MTLEDYNNLKVGDKVHHNTLGIDLYFNAWVCMRFSNKYVAGFSKEPPLSDSVKDFINSDDSILVSPEFIDKL